MKIALPKLTHIDTLVLVSVQEIVAEASLAGVRLTNLDLTGLRAKN